MVAMDQITPRNYRSGGLRLEFCLFRGRALMPCAAFCVAVFFATTRNAGLLIGVLGGGGCLGFPFFTLPLFPLCPAIRIPIGVFDEKRVEQTAKMGVVLWGI